MPRRPRPQQVDLLASSKRIDREVDGHALHAVAVLAEYAAYLLRGRSGAARPDFLLYRNIAFFILISVALRGAHGPPALNPTTTLIAGETYSS